MVAVAAFLALAALFVTGRGRFWPMVGVEVFFGVLWAIDFQARRTRSTRSWVSAA